MVTIVTIVTIVQQRSPDTEGANDIDTVAHCYYQIASKLLSSSTRIMMLIKLKVELYSSMVNWNHETCVVLVTHTVLMG